MMTRVWALNKKPMMTETPQTRKNFFLKKKVGPRKFFLEFFFPGGFANPCHHGFRSNQTPACHIPTRAPQSPGVVPLDAPRPTPTCYEVPSRSLWNPPWISPRFVPTGFANPTGRVIVGGVKPEVSCRQGERSERGSSSGGYPGTGTGVLWGAVEATRWAGGMTRGVLVETHDDTTRFGFKKPENKSLMVRGVGRLGWRKGSMTRGEGSRGRLGRSNGGVGRRSGDMTREGFDSTETHDDTGLQTPPGKKFQKKFFGGPTFFSRKKFLRVWGFLSSWVFYLKPNPCHRVLRTGSKPPCHHGFPPKPPVSHPDPPRPPTPLITSSCVPKTSPWSPLGVPSPQLPP